MSRPYSLLLLFTVSVLLCFQFECINNRGSVFVFHNGIRIQRTYLEMNRSQMYYRLIRITRLFLQCSWKTSYQSKNFLKHSCVLRMRFFVFYNNCQSTSQILYTMTPSLWLCSDFTSQVSAVVEHRHSTWENLTISVWNRHSIGSVWTYFACWNWMRIKIYKISKWRQQRARQRLNVR